MRTPVTDPASPQLIAYLDYRAFLRDWFTWRKAANPRFSHRMFARLAGQRSPSLLLHVIDGKRNLTAATTRSFARALKLDREDTTFFEALVQLDQATTDDERNEAWSRISTTRRFRAARRIEGAAFQCLSHWYYAAIHELANRPDFQADPRWLARTLRPRVTPTEARQALDCLQTLGLLVPDERGRLRPADASLITPHEVAGLAVHNYHRGMIDRARDSIDNADPDERHLLGVTVSVPAALVPRLKAELNQMQARLLDLCDSAEAPADVAMQINLQLFPLSHPPEVS